MSNASRTRWLVSRSALAASLLCLPVMAAVGISPRWSAATWTAAAGTPLAAAVALQAAPPNDDDASLPPLIPGGFRRGEVPDWEVDPKFRHDVFTFARVYFDSYRGRGRWQKCMTDYPDSDLNFSFRLQQLTSIKVDPQPVLLRLTDPRLFRYPMLYMCEPGDLVLDESEVQALRRYLSNGGFLMADDFWGEREWDGFWSEMRRVFPDRSYVELPADHEIFHNVYRLEKKPQVPSINHALSGRGGGRTWERSDAEEPHYRAVLDDRGRIMMLICHNTDLGDGWEREGMHEWYFREFSEKLAYPMGINIVTYAMSH